MQDKCSKCLDPDDRRRKVRLHFEIYHGMRLYREVNGRKVYSARCPACREFYAIDGGKA